MSNLIDRDAAIDAIEITPFDDYGDYMRARELIEQLPSAQPDEQCDNCHYKHIWMTQRMNGNGYFGHGGATG